MIQSIRVISIRKILFTLVFSLLTFYSGFCTYLLIKLDPKPVLIGIDASGTRLIRTFDDELLVREQENFLTHFLMSHYQYDATNFDAQISYSGDLMSSEFWELKKEKFQKISKQLKTEPLEQKVEIEDIRKIDLTSFEADLKLQILNKLKETHVKLRVKLKLKTHPRNELNPYPYEVDSYEEEVLS